MLYLKKYFTEGLIQVAILLSLCGVRVDVGLEPYLPPSWQDMILGPTLALTQVQLHDLQDCVEDDHGVPPKNGDLDGSFRTRRLLGWVRSLGRMQVPHQELETRLVQREPDPNQPSLLERAPAGGVRGRSGTSVVEPRAGLDTLQEDVEADDKEEGTRPALHHSGSLDEGGEEEEDEEEELARAHWGCGSTGVGRRPGGCDNDRELTRGEEDQTSDPLQECLRLLEETFPVTEEQQLRDDGGRGGDVECRLPPTLLPSITPTNGYSSDLELQWQDLLAVMGGMDPENTDVSTMTPLDQVLDSSLGPRTLCGVGPDRDCSMMDGGQLTTLQPGLMWSPTLLPLAPSAELDEPAWGGTCSTTGVLPGPPDYGVLLTEDLFDSSFHLDDLAPLEAGDMADPATPPADEEEDGLPSPLADPPEYAAMVEELRLLYRDLDEDFGPKAGVRPGEEGYLDGGTAGDQSGPGSHEQDYEGEMESDSGLSLGFSHSLASPSLSEASSSSSSSSSCSTSSSSSSSFSPSSCLSSVGDLLSADAEADGCHMDVEWEERELEVESAGGGCNLLNGLPWLHHVHHDHTYSQPSPSPCPSSPSSPSPSPSPSRQRGGNRTRSRDERRARALKIPFSNEDIVHLPVEEFNRLLDAHRLSAEQLALVRDIRRRGKNKVAAQNCRERKVGALRRLEGEVAGLRRRRQRLLRERQEVGQRLREGRRGLSQLCQELLSARRDGGDVPGDVPGDLLDFCEEWAGGRTAKKTRNKKKK